MLNLVPRSDSSLVYLLFTNKEWVVPDDHEIELQMREHLQRMFTFIDAQVAKGHKIKFKLEYDDQDRPIVRHIRVTDCPPRDYS